MKRKHDRENEQENSDLLVTESTFSPVKARRSSLPSSSLSSHCFFCESSDIPANLHSASTLEVDRRVREGASLVNDNKLIRKVASGDMVATEAKYQATRLKTCVLTAFLDLTTHAQGREVLLVLSHKIGVVLLEAKKRD